MTIRDMPDDTLAELVARAEASGRSLQEYVRSEPIALARRPEPDALPARVRDRKRRTGSRISVEQVLDHRDADRR